MDLDRWVKVFDRLLPRSRAWHLILDRTLRKFFHGLSILPKTVHEHIGSILLEAFPQTTTHLVDWSWQYGSPEELTADQLDYELADPGGQSPGYVQGLLHDNGFTNLYVHEWWETPSADPPVVRNPIPWTKIYRVLVNDLSHYEKHYLYQFGDSDSQFVGDESVSFGAYDRYFPVPKQYPCPDIIQEYPLYYYIGGYTWPNPATITESELVKVLRLIYKTKPCFLRCILMVHVVPDSIYDDIQDTTWEDDEIQDAVSATDDIQDHV